MPTLKKLNSATTVLFVDTSYIEKLVARGISLDESTPSAPVLKVDLSHYSKQKRGNLEDSDF
jgi:hypothetical protein